MIWHIGAQLRYRFRGAAELAFFPFYMFPIFLQGLEFSPLYLRRCSTVDSRHSHFPESILIPTESMDVQPSRTAKLCSGCGDGHTGPFNDLPDKARVGLLGVQKVSSCLLFQHARRLLVEMGLREKLELTTPP
jgi:hypothetical protein